MLIRASIYMTFVSSPIEPARAASDASESEAAAFTNVYSTMLERQFFKWHIWTTGVSRLNDGGLFGLTAVVLLMSFGLSGLGIILFRTSGLGFRSGWLVTLPAMLAAMLAFCSIYPYPGRQDLPWLLGTAALAGLVALIVGRAVKGAFGLSELDEPARPAAPKLVSDNRLKMAVRTSASRPR